MRPADSGRYPSGQRGQTVNLLAYAFGGSNPPLPTIVAGALVAGSDRRWAEIGATTRGTRVSARETGTTARVSAGEIGATATETRASWPDCLRKVYVVQLTGGNSSAVERQPSKLGVAGSNPVSRSTRSRASRASASTGTDRQDRTEAHVAQLAEHALGKGEVSGSIPDMGSILRMLGERQRD